MAFRRVFRDNCRLGAAGDDVICGGAVGWVGVDVSIKFGDNRSNRS